MQMATKKKTEKKQKMQNDLHNLMQRPEMENEEPPNQTVVVVWLLILLLLLLMCCCKRPTIEDGTQLSNNFFIIIEWINLCPPKAVLDRYVCV